MGIFEALLKNKILLIILFFTFSYSQEKVTLQLKWFHQFQFAGYYVAKEKGFYSEVGLDVEIKERDFKFNNIEQVINNQAQYGVADSALLFYKIQNRPVVIIAPIFQHSANILIALKSSGISTPYDLNDKNISMYANDIDSFSILAMLKKFNLKPKILDERKSDDYLKLINSEIDLTSAYLSNEIFYFKEKNIDINIINPMYYGFDFYGDMLFTSEEEAINHPLRVENFKNATLKGWEYALNHKEEVIDLIYNKYSNKKSKEHLRFEAEKIEEMIDKKRVPLGSIDKGRFKYISDLYKDYGLSQKSLEIKDFIFENYKNSLNLSKEELNFIKNKKQLKYCIDPNWMPFEKVFDGKHIGITADYFKVFEKELGITLKFVQTKSWSESLSFIKEGKCDTLSLVMPSNERKNFLNFTKPYIQAPLVVVTRNDEIFISNISEIENKKIGIVKDYEFFNVLKNRYPNINFIEVKDIDDGLKKVKSQELYGYIDTLNTVAYVIQNRYLTQLKVSGKLEESLDLAVGTSLNEPLLNSIFEKIINRLSLEDKQLIFNKYTSIKVEEKIDFKLIVLWILGIVLFFGIIIFIFFISNQKLKKEIKKREEISIIDSLTNIHNRRFFNEIAPKFINSGKRENELLSFLVIDVDYFKQYNDTYGHLMGDDALKEVAKLLKNSTLRSDDYCFRMGGEEFGILFKSKSKEKAFEFAKELLKKVENLRIEHINSKVSSYVTVSMGLFTDFARNLNDIDDMYKQADKMLYVAKEEGRNRVINYLNYDF